MNTIAQLQARAALELKGLYDEGETRFLCAVILEKLFHLAKIDIHLRKHEPLGEEGVNKFLAIVAELQRGRPYQYVLGEAVFAGLTFRLNEETLIPRPETEELVEWASASLGASDRALDVGTGSGCIAIALAARVPGVEWHGVDISTAAARVAAENARANGVEVTFLTRDITRHEEHAWPAYDLIVSNPPYVRLSERASMHDRVVKHEPGRALFVPDEDPLLFYRVIAGFGRRHLSPGGKLFFEINEALRAGVVALLEGSGYRRVESRRDLFGKDRMVRCERE
ncbi:MAG: peptide chain release factor N(5)-glutamine methyltransferase [Odoribacteraceae bacterium]|jgi:release factor glutamine methyltransferase|nr:peptide chain release factor N(5)-glutamine methyltransferase [Odoribacteraceae bacterium]